MANNITPTILIKLSEIFEEKAWDNNQEQEYSLFNRMSRTLSFLTLEEQNVFLKILGLVDYYTLLDYEKLLIDVLKKIDEVTGDNLKFFFVPIISNKDAKEVKSSMLVTYLLKANSIKYHDKLFKMHKTIKYELSSSDIRNINTKNKIVVLVDDFIGTGDSTIIAANNLLSAGLEKDKIIVMSLVTLEKGKIKVESEGYNFYCSKVAEPVSAKINSNDLDSIHENIKNITKKLKTNKKNEFLGFNESEALVSMIRTPNNSLNMLWSGNIKKNIPFPR